MNDPAPAADILAAYSHAFNGDHPGRPEKTEIPLFTAADENVPVLVDAVLNRSALRTLPDPEPLIGNVLDQGTTALLFGRHGTLKSFIALDWSASVATGRRWQNRRTEQRRVLYAAAEGAFGFKRRIEAWETGWQTEIGDDDFDILPHPVNLTRPLDVGNLAALIEWNGYGLVVLDTLARCMVGADENSARDCGVVVDAMTRLLARTPGGRGVVLGVHHAGKDGKTFRGSSAFEAGADTVYSTTKDGGVVVLERTKRKDGPETDRHELRFDPIEGTESGTISASHPRRSEHRSEALLSHFLSHFANTGASAAQLRDTCELTRATFYRALDDVVQRGDLVNTGTDQRPFYKAGKR